MILHNMQIMNILVNQSQRKWMKINEIDFYV